MDAGGTWTQTVIPVGKGPEGLDLSPNGRGHFNVAIRTVAIDRVTGQAEFGVGSGIVWDSAARDEYEECLLKASILLERVPASYAAGAHPETPEGSRAWGRPGRRNPRP